ncbi:hypothetical protein [Streptomyces odontomachi]|nr:hypothetical protein [Streptomyces sp. ODS25]
MRPHRARRPDHVSGRPGASPLHDLFGAATTHARSSGNYLVPGDTT